VREEGVGEFELFLAWEFEMYFPHPNRTHEVFLIYTIGKEPGDSIENITPVLRDEFTRITTVTL